MTTNENLKNDVSTAEGSGPGAIDIHDGTD